MKRPSKAEAEKKFAWSLPEDPSRRVPSRREPGSFAEDRGDRSHCGVDLYAPAGSKVVSIDDGLVVEVAPFTSPEMIPYWNETFFVTIQDRSGILRKYAEIGAVSVQVGEPVEGGQAVGRVGQVLAPEMIGPGAPLYIRAIRDSENVCMLHFEMLSRAISGSEHYLGGNWFGRSRPPALLDPTPELARSLGLRSADGGSPPE